jgi:RHS repeat-associated protein
MSSDYIKILEKIETREYDNWGNITSQTTESYPCNTLDLLFKTTTSNTYSSINCIWNANNKLNTSTVSSEHLDANGQAPFIRESEYLYYGNGLLKNVWLDKNMTFNGKNLGVRKDYEYDTYGNLTKETILPEGQSIGSRVSIFTYSSDGRFNTSTSNGLGYTASKTYDPKHGYLQSVTDIIGKSALYQYNFDKQYGYCFSITDPEQNKVTITSKWKPEKDYPIVVNSDDKYYGSSNVYYDSYKREIAADQDVFNGGKSITTNTYDSDGLLSSYTNPDKIFKSAKNVSLKYDKIDRVVSVTDNLTGNTSTYNYNQDAKRTVLEVTQPDGKQQHYTFNAIGDLVNSRDNIGNTVQYFYNNSGQVSKISAIAKDGTNKNVTFEYDPLGRQVGMMDDNAGLFEYKYNAYNELVEEKTPNGYTLIEYDNIGRIKSKTYKDKNGNALTSENITYNYYESGSGKGEIKEILGPGEQQYQKYEYDANGKINRYMQKIRNKEFVYNYAYNTKGDIEYITYPSGVKIKYVYDNIGNLKATKRVTQTGGEITLWELKEINDDGNITQEKKSDGKIEDRTLYNNVGVLTGIESKQVSSGNMLLQHKYDYNIASGNLESREDLVNAQKESFEYDDLDRLIKTTVNNRFINDIEYYPDGRIKSKTDVGVYSYNNSLPVDAVKSVTTNLPLSSQNIDYNQYNSPVMIDGGDGIHKDIEYGEDEQRIASYDRRSDNIVLTEKFYLDNYEEYIDENQDTKKVTYIDGASGVVAVVVQTVTLAGVVEKTYYVNTDHLGSIVGLVDENGNQVPDAVFSYDAWGRIRNGNNWANYSISDNTKKSFNILGRGFTGHEHLLKDNIINMNGRIYDPTLGQFLQADNNIQSPDYHNSYNRYAYCFNNPLKYTDPSGEFIQIPALLAGVFYIGSSISHIANVAHSTGSWDAALSTSIGELGSLIRGGMYLASGISSLGVNPTQTVLYGGASPVSPGDGGGSSFWGDLENAITTVVKVLVPGVGYGVDMVDAFNKGNYLEAGGWAIAAGVDIGLTVYTAGVYKAASATARVGINTLKTEVKAIRAETSAISKSGVRITEGIFQNGIRSGLASVYRDIKGRFITNEVVVYASKASKVSAACFIAGTIIMTDAGEKPIENIKPGDKVWTYNIESGAQELAEVPNNFSRSAQDFVRLYFAGDSVTCTLEHPFYVDKDWAAAERLKAGDSLFCYGGAKLAIDSVYKFHTDTATAVYNLEAAGNHNYYVAKTKVLAHNCENISKVTSRISRKGEKAIEVIYKDGSIIDINPSRVKKWTPNTHPNAPPNAVNAVKFENAIPGTKGKKRLPTKTELDMLNRYWSK